MFISSVHFSKCLLALSLREK